MAGNNTLDLSWFAEEGPTEKQGQVKVERSPEPKEEKPIAGGQALRKDDIKELSDIEHVLHRPAIYVGSVTEEDIPTFVYQDGKIVQKDIRQIPALCKIIDEIIDNSVDEAIRTNFKFATKISVSFKQGTIAVEDNGRGLPIEQKPDGKWTPEIIYTKLRAGSNFEDAGRQTMGMNGVGSSLTNIFSKKFAVSTSNGKLSYEQVFENSMQRIGKPVVKKNHRNFTVVEFTPNYDYFNASQETIDNLPILIEKRLKNLAFAFPEIRFVFNGTTIAAGNLNGFLKQIHEVFEFNETDDARIGVFYSDTDFQHLSFVNGLETKRGGTHIDNVTYRIVEHIREFIKRKYKFDVKPIDIKSKIFLMFSMRITNAQFDGQTKERLMNSITEYKDVIDRILSDKFLKSLQKNEEIIAPIVEAYRIKMEAKDNLELKKMVKPTKKVRVDKYFPAVGRQRYLFLTEGDSANGSLMPVLGREEFSYFALRGVPLNCHETPISRIKDNEELKNLVTILNMDLTRDRQDELTHEAVVFATDQDADGKHIRALALAFFNRFSPSLIKMGRIKFLRTPITVGKKKGKIVKYFFELDEYNAFIRSNPNHGLDFHYYKGLGTWEKEDLKFLIEKEGLDHFIQTFEWDETAAVRIEEWLGKRNADIRKDYIRGRKFTIDCV